MTEPGMVVGIAFVAVALAGCERLRGKAACEDQNEETSGDKSAHQYLLGKELRRWYARQGHSVPQILAAAYRSLFGGISGERSGIVICWIRFFRLSGTE